MVHDPAAHEDHRGVLGLAQARQQHLGENERRGQIHVQYPAPGGHVVLFERRAVAEQGGCMHQPVELAEFPADGFRQTVVLGGRGGREIEHRDGRLRPAERLDLIVEPIEFRAVAARPGSRSRPARAQASDERAAEAAARARDQDGSARRAGPEARRLSWAADIGSFNAQAPGARRGAPSTRPGTNPPAGKRRPVCASPRVPGAECGEHQQMAQRRPLARRAAHRPR